jgi:hypothetical protein
MGWVDKATPRPLYPPMKTRYPLYRGLGGPHSRSEQVRKISPHWNLIPGPSSPQRVAIPTELSRLRAVDKLSLKELNTQLFLKAPTSKEQACEGHKANNRRDATSCAIYFQDMNLHVFPFEEAILWKSITNCSLVP